MLPTPVLANNGLMLSHDRFPTMHSTSACKARPLFFCSWQEDVMVVREPSHVHSLPPANTVRAVAGVCVYPNSRGSTKLLFSARATQPG